MMFGFLSIILDFDIFSRHQSLSHSFYKELASCLYIQKYI
uniref:Uncharacterized protein n=1 Tax=Arundo donax TaxID=35708 RepID=A0A0A9DLE2_ARUDO